MADEEVDAGNVFHPPPLLTQGGQVTRSGEVKFHAHVFTNTVGGAKNLVM